MNRSCSPARARSSRTLTTIGALYPFAGTGKVAELFLRLTNKTGFKTSGVWRLASNCSRLKCQF